MKKRMRLNLMAGSAAVFLIMFFVTVGFMVLSFFTFRDHVKLRMWAGCLAVGILLLLFALFLFILYVYRPVQKLKEAIGQLDAIGTGNSVDLWADADTMADSVHALLQELRDSVEREHAEVMLRQQSQYAQLQNQINPHFLYNTLETIRGQAVIDDN